MSSLKATSQLARLCEHVPPQRKSQLFLQHDPDVSATLREDALEQRWQGQQPGAAPGAEHPVVAHPQTALALQLDRAKVACDSAGLNLIVAKGKDKLVLNGMVTCRQDLGALMDDCQKLSDLPAAHPVWHKLLDQAYALGKALDGAMQRLDLPTCSSIGMDLMSRSRGQFGLHEVYALAAVLEHIPGHTLPCDDLRTRLQGVYQRGRKTQDLDYTLHLTTDDKAALNAFLAHPMVNAVLEDAHRLQHDTQSTRLEKPPEYAFSAEVLAAKAGQGNEMTHLEMAKILQEARNRRDALLVRAHMGVPKLCPREMEEFLGSPAGRKLDEEWNALNQELAQVMLQPHEYARYREDNSLRNQLKAMVTATEILDLKQLLSAKAFQVPETLRREMQALNNRASNRVISTALRENLRDVSRKITAIYREATDSNSIAMELAFVLDASTQDTLLTLRQRLTNLAKAIDKKPLKPNARQRRGKPVPASGANAASAARASSSFSSSLEESFDSDDDLEAEEEAAQEAETALAPPPAELQAAHRTESPTASTGPAPLRTLWINGRPTPLRTRLSTSDALALIDSSMAPGTFSSPLRSAIYHYRRHVPRAQDGQAGQPIATIEEYLAAAQRRFSEWDGHTVTHGRGNGEMLALVEQRPRGWFTRDGKVVSFCYEDG